MEHERDAVVGARPKVRPQPGSRAPRPSSPSAAPQKGQRRISSRGASSARNLRARAGAADQTPHLQRFGYAGPRADRTSRGRWLRRDGSAALPRCRSLLTIRVLLRTPVARRLVAAPSRRPLARHGRRRSSAASESSPACSPRPASRSRRVLVPASRELGGILGGCAILFVAGLLDDLYRLSPLAKIAAQSRRRRARARAGVRVEIVSQRRARHGDRRRVARRDDERLQPARQHGRARRDPRGDRLRVLRDRRRHRAPEPPRRPALARHLLRVPRLPAVQPSPARPGGGLHGRQRQPGARVRVSPRSGSRRAGRSQARRSRRSCCRSSSSRSRFSTRRSSRSCDSSKAGRSTSGGRDHTSHRLVYQGLSDKRAVVLLALVSGALGLTSLAYNVLDDTRITLVGVLLTFAFLLQFGSYLARVDRAAGSCGRDIVPPLAARAPAPTRSRSLVDFALITASFTLAYMIRVEGRPGAPWHAARLRAFAAGDPRRALHRVRPLRPVSRRVALRRSTRRREHLRRGRRLGEALRSSSSGRRCRGEDSRAARI